MVLVALGVSIVTLSSVQHTTSAQALQSVRAIYAARAGLEWALATSGNNGCDGAGGAARTSSIALTEAALDGFTVTVTCTGAQHPFDTSSVWYYQVSANAQSGVYPSPDYVSRTLSSKVIGQ